MTTLTERELQLLWLAHDHPGLTRARAAALLDASSGTTTGLVKKLVAAHLLDERAAAPTGHRGRPTSQLVPHPQGPLVLAGVVDHESWRVHAVQLGGTRVAAVTGEHDGQHGERLIQHLREAVGALGTRFGARVRGVGLAVPGLVRGTVLIEAPLLGWRDLDLAPVGRQASPPLGSDAERGARTDLIVGNDATFAALGEARRGAAAGARLHLHLHLDAGLGGAVTLNGTALTGAHGLGGEFGHMPFGEPGVRCPCGALGCWTTAVGVAALAAAMGDELPRQAVAYGKAILSRAADGDRGARRAVATLAASLGRGIAALVNGLDVDLVTLGGLAPMAAEIAPREMDSTYRAGLMRFRRADAPRIVPAALGDRAPETGVAEQVWSHVWSRS